MDGSGFGFDPCECLNILGHQARMQRLISMLRESQSECTDNECLDLAGPSSGQLIRPDGSSGGFNPTMTTVMFLWVALAAVLFLMRPTSLRGGRASSEDELNGKPTPLSSNSHDSSSRGPPPPPPVL